MRLQHCPWLEVDDYLARADGVIVPIGSTEQHGPNGLIGTDAICAEVIAEAVDDRVDTLIAPTIAYAQAQFNLGFAGTVSVRAATMARVVADCVRSLAHHGFRHVYFLNAHGANLAPAQAAFQDLYAEASLGGASGGLRCRIRSWWDHPAVDEIRARLYGDLEGLHATPSEIAITQAALPGRVRAAPDAARKPLPPEALRNHAGDNHFDAESHARAYPDGTVGSDPALASAQAGRSLIDAAAEAIAEDYRRFLEE